MPAAEDVERQIAVTDNRSQAPVERTAATMVGRPAHLRHRAGLRRHGRPRGATPRSDPGGTGRQADRTAQGPRPSCRQIDAQPVGTRRRDDHPLSIAPKGWTTPRNRRPVRPGHQRRRFIGQPGDLANGGSFPYREDRTCWSGALIPGSSVGRAGGC